MPCLSAPARWRGLETAASLCARLRNDVVNVGSKCSSVGVHGRPSSRPGRRRGAGCGVAGGLPSFRIQPAVIQRGKPSWRSMHAASIQRGTHASGGAPWPSNRGCRIRIRPVVGPVLRPNVEQGRSGRLPVRPLRSVGGQAALQVARTATMVAAPLSAWQADDVDRPAKTTQATHGQRSGSVSGGPCARRDKRNAPGVSCSV
jgi:hypothetical protein